MKPQFIIFVIMAAVLTSCDSAKKTSSLDNLHVSFSEIPTETFWKLDSWQGKDYSNFINNDNEVGFTLFADNNQISGYSGCNHFFGSFKLKQENGIRFSTMGGTKTACLNNDFDENEFLKIFELVDNYILIDDKLELNVGENAALAVFKKVNKQSDKITEKYWKLKTLEENSVEMVENQKREVYFTLKEDNTVTGFAGCNTLFGSYNLATDNRIHFSQMASTRMACPDVDFNETQFLKVFELADNYTIVDDVLILSLGKRALAIFEAVYFE